MLRNRFSAIGLETLAIDSIAVFRQQNADSRFRIVKQWKLRSKAFSDRTGSPSGRTLQPVPYLLHQASGRPRSAHTYRTPRFTLRRWRHRVCFDKSRRRSELRRMERWFSFNDRSRRVPLIRPVARIQSSRAGSDSRIASDGWVVTTCRSWRFSRVGRLPWTAAQVWRAQPPPARAGQHWQEKARS